MTMIIMMIMMIIIMFMLIMLNVIRIMILFYADTKHYYIGEDEHHYEL